MSEDALEGYLRPWREANPQRTIAWLFLAPSERACFGALAALEAEWLKAVREVRESQVAATKLGWWREEVQHASAGQPHHPLTQALFADARARAVPTAAWVAAVDAATVALDGAPAADFEGLCAAAAPFATAVADLETAVWFGGATPSARAQRVTLLAHLTAMTRALAGEVEHGRSPLPMNLLARHGLTLGQLAADGPARRLALHDHLATLELAQVEASALTGPLTLFRAIGLRHDRSALRRASRASGDPLPVLRASAHGVIGTVAIWREARAWRRAARHRCG